MLAKKTDQITVGLSFLNNYFTGKKVAILFHCFFNLCSCLMSRVTYNVKSCHCCKILKSLRICILKVTSFSFLKSGVRMQHLNVTKGWILWLQFICIFLHQCLFKQHFGWSVKLLSVSEANLALEWPSVVLHCRNISQILHL